MLSDFALQGTTYLTFPVPLSQHFWRFWTRFAESVYMRANDSGKLHSWSSEGNKSPVLPGCTQSPGPWAVPQPRGLAGAFGWAGAVVHQGHCPSTPAQGGDVQCQALPKHVPAFCPGLPGSPSGLYLLFPRRCPLLELYMIVWYIEPNVSPG